MEQKPSVGRTVHFTPPQECRNDKTPEFYAAIITQVNLGPPEGAMSDLGETVELVTFGPNSVYFQHRVPFAPEHKPGTWTWPPRV